MPSIPFAPIDRQPYQRDRMGFATFKTASNPGGCKRPETSTMRSGTLMCCGHFFTHAPQLTQLVARRGAPLVTPTLIM